MPVSQGRQTHVSETESTFIAGGIGRVVPGNCASPFAHARGAEKRPNVLFIWAYYRMIEKVDAGIGQVLTSLRDSGQEENTLIAFVGCHGDCHGAHKWNQKTVFYDESTRVPFIIRQPGVTAKSTSARLVNTGVDLKDDFPLVK